MSKNRHDKEGRKNILTFMKYLKLLKNLNKINCIINIKKKFSFYDISK